MYEIKNNTTVYLPVRFFDQTGVPMSGVSYTTVSGTVLHSDNTLVLVTPASAADFFEVTFGDFTGAGVYLLRVTGTNLAVNGVLSYAVSTTVVGAKKHVGVVSVVAQLESDSFARLGAPAGASVSADIAAIKLDTTTVSTINTKIGTPTGASVSADIAAIQTKLGTPAGASVSADVAGIQTKLGTPAGASVSADIAAAKVKIDILMKIETGHWRIFKTGPNANKMIIYDVDGTTPIYTFNLFDDTGAATSSNPFERVPVP